MAILKKLNYWHIALIILLPIMLALINPNWIFNVNMADDYDYLGYQLYFPKFTDWYPSADVYLIERMTVILPGYVIRQIVSPVLANFMIHLGVYYAVMFSAYGILNLLYNAKVAIIITLLMGQYPLIMRATGWDYPDGYALAYFALTIFFLSQAVGSKRRPFYLACAGGAFLFMLNAHFFNIFYFPAIVVYYLLIHRWQNTRQTLISPVLFGGVGVVIAYLILAIIYYALTNRILFTNTLTVSDSSDWLKSFLRFNFLKTDASWHFMLLTVTLIILGRPLLWRKSTFTPPDKPQFKNARVILRALLGLFALSYLVFVVWYFRGFIYLKVSYYHANLILIAFLLLGALFSARLTKYPDKHFKYLMLGAFFIPMIPLAVFSFTPQNLLITDSRILYVGGILCMVVALYPKRTLYALIGFSMFAGMMLHQARTYKSGLFPAHPDVYVADRYLAQSIYEYAVQMSGIINDRYDSFSYDEFRFFSLKGGDTHSRLFNSTVAIFLWTWHRDRILTEATLLTEAQETNEIIILTSVSQSEEMIQKLRQAIDVTELDRHLIRHPRGDIEMIFFRVN